MPATVARLDGNSVLLEFATVDASYEGRLHADSLRLEGELVNSRGRRFTLDMEPAQP